MIVRAALLAVAAAAAAAAAVVAPMLQRRVNDLAGIVSEGDEATLEALLADLERTDSTQIVLLTIPTTGDTPIEEYALEVARKNQIGQAGRNNGALVVIAVEDRRVRIEVGEGLEGRLPDSVCALIIKHEMVPRFREGNLSAGARAGVEAIVRAVRGEFRAPAGGRGGAGARARGPGGPFGEHPPPMAFVALVGVSALVLRAFRRWAVALGLVPLWALLGWALLGMSILSAAIVALGVTVVALVMSLQGGARGVYGGRRTFGYGGLGGGGARGFSGGGGRFAGGGASASW